VVTIFDAPFSERRLCADGDHAPLTVAADLSSIVNTSAAMTLPATTWHVRIAVSLGMSANKVSTVPAGSHASSVGANTVNACALSVGTKPAAVTAAARVLNARRNRGVNNVMHEIRSSISTIVERM
jgi:hypothetical protein